MSMLKRQVWMAADDEFDHIVKNSQRLLRLNDQYENHPYVVRGTIYLNMEHTIERGRQMISFLWVIYGIYFQKTLYQTTQAVFAGK